MITILPGESACYRCLLPKLPPQNVIQGCKEAGVTGTTAGITGVLQANEIIKFILGEGSLLSRKLLMIDLLNSSFKRIIVEKNPGCKLCGNNPTITSLINNQEFYSQK